MLHHFLWTAYAFSEFLLVFDKIATSGTRTFNVMDQKADIIECSKTGQVCSTIKVQSFHSTMNTSSVIELGVCASYQHCHRPESKEVFCRNQYESMKSIPSGSGGSNIQINQCDFTNCCDLDLCNRSRRVILEKTQLVKWPKLIQIT